MDEKAMREILAQEYEKHHIGDVFVRDCRDTKKDRQSMSQHTLAALAAMERVKIALAMR